MRILLIASAALLAVVVVIAIVGWRLPIKHRAARQAFLAVTPEAVYAVISSPKNFPSWRSKVKSVEMLPDSERRVSYRETGDDGSILYIVDEAVPAHRLVTRIADPSLPFGGTWTYELAPTDGGTALRITENGEVYNILFRIMSKYVFGHEATIDGYLRDLGRHFGQTVTITGVS